MNDKLECGSVAQPHSREVSNVSRREATNAEIFSERHDRRVLTCILEFSVSAEGLVRLCYRDLIREQRHFNIAKDRADMNQAAQTAERSG